MECQNCGDTEDVIYTNDWVGGQGPVNGTSCRDQQACWKRRDKQKEKDGQKSNLD